MKWIVVIADYEMTRTPQTTHREEEVEAPTAADAITIARLRFRVGEQPSTWMNPHWTEIVNVRWKDEKLF